tara:strand:+ start:644 stop:877 length:234 start_codon:yes stop_codon:yes gene_type:complete
MTDLLWRDIEFRGLDLEIGYYFDGDGCQVKHVTLIRDFEDRDDQTEITSILSEEAFELMAEVISENCIQDDDYQGEV